MSTSDLIDTGAWLTRRAGWARARQDRGCGAALRARFASILAERLFSSGSGQPDDRLNGQIRAVSPHDSRFKGAAILRLSFMGDEMRRVAKDLAEIYLSRS